MAEESTFRKIASSIVDFAPGIAGLLATTGVGAPAAAAMAALGGLGKMFGLGSEATPEDIHAAIQADPQMALKLRQAELDFKLKSREQDIDELKAQLGDVQSARQRQIEVTKATGKKDTNLYALAWVIMGGFIGLIAALIVCQFVFAKSLTADPLITLCVGALSTDAGMVVGYFFGSSKSSADKTALLVAK